MEGDFKEHVPGYYTLRNAQEIDDFDPDQYGNKWYNVIFQGDAETFMWLKKDPPEEGKKYYGHIEPTKSGKRLRFKTDKLPEGAPAPSGATSGSKPQTDYEPGTNARWAIGLAYRACIQVTGSLDSASGDFPFDLVETHAGALVNMFERIKNSPVERKILETRPTEVRGYDKFKQTADNLKSKEPDEPPDWVPEDYPQ